MFAQNSLDPALGKELPDIYLALIISVRHEPGGERVGFVLVACAGVGYVVEGVGAVARMHEDVAELVAEDGGLLPFFEAVVDEDILAPEDPSPHAVDVIGERRKHDLAAHIFRDAVRVCGGITSYEVPDA